MSMISPTYGQVDDNRILEILLNFYNNNKDLGSEFELTVGTDSQNFSYTKVVKVLAMRCVGHGGIYFYEVTHIDRIQDVRMKLNYETNESLKLANNLLQKIENDPKYSELILNTNFAIHVDAGTSSIGKTKDLIPSLVGWIHSMGYDCVVKPDSYTSSSIADKISK